MELDGNELAAHNQTNRNHSSTLYRRHIGRSRNLLGLTIAGIVQAFPHPSHKSRIHDD